MLQNMHIVKQNLQNCSKFSQKCNIIFITLFSKLLIYIVNISSYQKQLKLH